MEKRKFLYYNLNETNNNKLNIIHDYIVNSDIHYNENQNGLLLNLSKVDDKHIDKLYDLYNLKENKIQYDLSHFKSKNQIKKKQKIKIKYKNYNLTNLEKLILSYS